MLYWVHSYMVIKENFSVSRKITSFHEYLNENNMEGSTSHGFPKFCLLIRLFYKPLFSMGHLEYYKPFYCQNQHVHRILRQGSSCDSALASWKQSEPSCSQGSRETSPPELLEA